MKRIVSVSIGSAKRDSRVEADILGEHFLIERVGTDGDKNKAKRLIAELDGQVDAFGLGGIDLFLWAGRRRYAVRDAVEIARAAKISPVVDGSGLKHTLERKVASFVEKETGYSFKGKKILMVSAVDRLGLAESLAGTGAHMTFGDLIFALHIPIPLHSLSTLNLLALVILPVVTRLPFEYLYPTGKSQETSDLRHARFYDQADVIAGDFHFIRRYMPSTLGGKVIITNTVTYEDVELLRKAGVSMLVTTTPELGGRSFGTNVVEAILVSLAGKRPEELSFSDYEEWLEKTGFRPRIVKF